MFYFTFVLILNAILMVQNAPIPPLMTRTASTGCMQYTIINTRGTDEPQGESVAVRPMNQQVISSMSGGKIVNTVYSAGNTQNSEEGSQAIMNAIHSALQQNPNECIVLEGYSQGAAATTYAMPRMDQTSFDAVKAVVLLGNPMHRADSQSNAVLNGNDGMRGGGGGSGLQSFQGGIPNNWVDKTLDICEPGDPICQGTQGGDWSQHTKYAYDNNAQTMAANFILKHLSGTDGDSQPNPSSTSPTQPQISNQGIPNNPYSSYNPYSAYSMPQQTGSNPWSQPSTGYGPNRFSGYTPSQQTEANRYPAYSWPPSGYGVSRSSKSLITQSTRSGTDPSYSWTSFIPSFLTSKHT